ncbi:MAG: Holliday junction resolvase RuvX [Ignavibacteriae bacterium]|nr:Holliday junction resolvase RuvX [Ignavibacteriota bacterium]
MSLNKDNNIQKYKGIRIGSVDYGLKRVGFAVCDEFHVTITPKHVFDRTSPNFWNDLTGIFVKENIGLLIVGIPLRLSGEKANILDDVMNFIKELKTKCNIEIITFDESYSTRKSVRTMLEIGMKKRKRAIKGNKDKIAAAIILRDFLQELELK